MLNEAFLVHDSYGKLVYLEDAVHMQRHKLRVRDVDGIVVGYHRGRIRSVDVADRRDAAVPDQELAAKEIEATKVEVCIEDVDLFRQAVLWEFRMSQGSKSAEQYLKFE